MPKSHDLPPLTPRTGPVPSNMPMLPSVLTKETPRWAGYGPLVMGTVTQSGSCPPGRLEMLQPAGSPPSVRQSTIGQSWAAISIHSLLGSTTGKLSSVALPPREGAPCLIIVQLVMTNTGCCWLARTASPENRDIKQDSPRRGAPYQSMDSAAIRHGRSQGFTQGRSLLLTRLALRRLPGGGSQSVSNARYHH